MKKFILIFSILILFSCSSTEGMLFNPTQVPSIKNYDIDKSERGVAYSVSEPNYEIEKVICYTTEKCVLIKREDLLDIIARDEILSDYAIYVNSFLIESGFEDAPHIVYYDKLHEDNEMSVTNALKKSELFADEVNKNGELFFLVKEKDLNDYVNKIKVLKTYAEDVDKFFAENSAK